LAVAVAAAVDALGARLAVGREGAMMDEKISLHSCMQNVHKISKAEVWGGMNKEFP